MGCGSVHDLIGLVTGKNVNDRGEVWRYMVELSENRADTSQTFENISECVSETEDVPVADLNFQS